MAVSNVASKAWGVVKNVASLAWEGVKTAAGWAGNAVKDATKWVGNAAKDVGKWIGDKAASAWNGVKDFVKHDPNKYADPSLQRTVKSIQDANGTGYSTFGKLKNAIGSPGAGKQWHHIVEQSQIGKSGFNPTQIHNTSNVIALDKATHASIRIDTVFDNFDQLTSLLLSYHWS